MCKVSVIIPNYCHSAYLDQRIQSILNQTFQDFEIIILDDNSPDEGKSRKIIEKYRGTPHVSHIVYNEKNSGSTFKQWDKGISLAKGEFVWIAESDDYCSPKLLERLIQAVDTGNKDISLAFCQSVWVNSIGKIIKRPICDDTIQIFETKRFLEWFMLLGNGVTNASSAIFRKDASLNITKDYMNYKGAGDRLFWIKIAERGNVAFVNSGLNFFRQHGDNTTARCYVDGTNFLEDKKIFDYLCKRYHISWRNRIYVYRETMKFANDVKLKNDNIRQKVMQEWNMPLILKAFETFLKIIRQI